MTAVVWKNGMLLVDSFVDKGGEWMQVSDKVMSVKRDMYLVCPDKGLDDQIIGLTYSGARHAVMAFAKALHQATVDMAKSVSEMATQYVKEPDPSVLPDRTRYSVPAIHARYKQAQDLGLINAENHFTVLLIGIKHVYVADMTADGGLTIVQQDDDAALFLGSGQTKMHELEKRNGGHAAPIRMMHYACLMEPSVGGRISQYERLVDHSSPVGYELVLTGIYNAPTMTVMKMAEAAACEPFLPDLILNTDSYRHLKRLGADQTTISNSLVIGLPPPKSEPAPVPQEGNTDEPHQAHADLTPGQTRKRRSPQGGIRGGAPCRNRLGRGQAVAGRSRHDRHAPRSALVCGAGPTDEPGRPGNGEPRLDGDGQHSVQQEQQVRGVG